MVLNLFSVLQAIVPLVRITSYLLECINADFRKLHFIECVTRRLQAANKLCEILVL